MRGIQDVGRRTTSEAKKEAGDSCLRRHATLACLPFHLLMLLWHPLRVFASMHFQSVFSL